MKLNGGRAALGAAVDSTLRGLAIRVDSEEHLPVFDWMSVLNANFFYHSVEFGLDLVHDFHGLDDAEDLTFRNTCADRHIRFGTWVGPRIERPDHGRFHLEKVRLHRLGFRGLGLDRRHGFDEMPERGCLRGWSSQHILDLLRALEGAGLIEASRGEYPTISTTRRGDQVGIGKLDPNELGLQMPTLTKRSRVRKRKR